MVEAKNDLGTTLYFLTIEENVRPEVPWQGGKGPRLSVKFT